MIMADNILADNILYEGCDPRCPALVRESMKSGVTVEGAIVPDFLEPVNWSEQRSPVIKKMGYYEDGRCTHSSYNTVEGKPGNCCMRQVRSSKPEAMG